jgi:aldose 1-epimerase
MPGGIRLEVIDYGAIVRTLEVRDRDGVLRDVVLGYDDLQGYEEDKAYIGAAIGRYANRIGNSRFELDGTTYQLSANEGAHHLHGGLIGFDKVVWRSRAVEHGDATLLILEHESPDGDEGYPGTLFVQITYGITASNVFSVDYAARSDRPTPVNLTHHAYFNLAGAANRDVLDHRLTIHADSFTVVDREMIPTGELMSVSRSPLDFRAGERIGTRIRDGFEQLRLARGYDHNFVLAKPNKELSLAASVVEPASGIAMEVHTTEPGVQFYSGNFLQSSRPGKLGIRYKPRDGFCLETQHFPDSPNHPEFPSTILRAGEEYRSRTEYRFSVQ